MNSTSPSAWFLAQLKPNCGSIAERNLAQQGFATFLPMERRTKNKNGQLIQVKVPYFPGYIFVRDDARASPWRAIHSTYGISRLVSFGARPAPVPPEIINQLLECCDSHGCIQRLDQFAVGDEVQVCDGPLVNFTGIVDKLAPAERAWLLIDIMGKATRSLVRCADLRLAST
ncbi:transcription termination/antitermination protein NusG [Qipengyuania gaetbuli]|uniref:transcription termination/antitermination protein NusG n=1 Tax=Qipengyuania gaetbuli TaxID=266952 RepID=UPI001CFC5188|nr:transcriptional activator RfaH [Qipengyuania gaetbuli]